jgi:DNA polymerase I-like protein with 3'-5' exonuclease and polymerase domains
VPGPTSVPALNVILALPFTIFTGPVTLHRPSGCFWNATYRGVARWQREQEIRTRQTRVYRFAWEANGDYSRNLALNLPIQGTAAEIAVEALARIDARLRATLPGKAQLVLQVHDEFVVEAEDNEAVVLETTRIVEEAMIAAFEALLPGAPVRGLVTAHSGTTWAAAKG